MFSLRFYSYNSFSARVPTGHRHLALQLNIVIKSLAVERLFRRSESVTLSQTVFYELIVNSIELIPQFGYNKNSVLLYKEEFL